MKCDCPALWLTQPKLAGIAYRIMLGPQVSINSNYGIGSNRTPGGLSRGEEGFY